MDHTNEELLREIDKLKYNEDGKAKLRCIDALNIASRLEISPGMVGTVCNEKNIRLSHCQLGCFT